MIPITPLAFGKVVTTWDWELVNNQDKTTIIYCFEDVKAKDGLPSGLTWKGEMDAAAANWNAGNTGWTFEVTNPGNEDDEGKITDDCQLVLKLRDHNIRGGGFTNLTDNCDPSFRHTPGDRVARVSLCIDPTPVFETLTGSKINLMWGKTGQLTFDPEVVLKHEMSHAMRLDHPTNSPQSAHITDPRNPGDHRTTLSDKDKQEASDSVDRTKSPLTKKSTTIGPSGGNCNSSFPVIDSDGEFLGDDYELNVPGDALSTDIDVSCIPAFHHGVPFRFSVPLGASPINLAYAIFSDPVALAIPATVSITYYDSLLGDPEMFGPDGILEPMLTAYRFEGDSEVDGEWVPVSGPQIVDPIANTVTFQTNSLPGLFGVGAHPMVLFGASHLGSSGPSTLVAINQHTGGFVEIGPIGSNRCSAMDTDASGRLLGVCADPSDDSLGVVEIDTATGAGILIAPLGGPDTIDRVAGASIRDLDDVLYAGLKSFTQEFRDLGTIDKDTGLVNRIGPLGSLSGLGNAMAWSPDDILFHADDVALNIVNPDTGETSQVDLLGFDQEPVDLFRINAMDFSLNPGVLFGSLNDGMPAAPLNFLVTIDTTTAQVNTIGQTRDGLDALAFVPLPPVLQADLSISKSADIDPIVAGNTLTYTTTVNNAGPDDAQNVVVTDTLPAGVTFVSTSGCAEDPNGVPPCSLGTITAGGSAQYTVTVTVDSGTSGTITNQVAVTTTTEDPNSGNNAITEDTTVSPPDMMPVCGNSIIEPPETCDDGNTTPGDGCSATCQIEAVGGIFEGVDTTALLVAGAQMNAAWMIPVLVAGIGFAIVIARKF